MGTPTIQPASAAAVRYRLLGRLSASRTTEQGEQFIDLGPPKQRAVLALLLLDRGRIVSADRLIDALWGVEPPPSALPSLQAYVSNLRRALRDEAGASSPIIRRAAGYVLDVPQEDVDLAEFITTAHDARKAGEQQLWPEAFSLADHALGLWRGELLEDLRDQSWAELEIEQLEQLRTECRETLITALLATGRASPALEAAQELRSAHPLRDRTCWLLMMALHRAGQSSEALEQYGRHVRALDEELGLDPGTELRELQVAILRHEPALAAWPRAAGWTGAAKIVSPEQPATIEAPVRPEPKVSEGLFVGREREDRMLDEILADARSERTRWLLLTGPAGIGKTRLAQELIAKVRTGGGTEVWARCSEESGAPAWWPIRQLVRALGEDPDVLLVPPAGVDLDEARFVLYERVASLLERVAVRDGLLALVIDDVQWADRTSVRCLAHLVGGLRELPIVFALTLRAGEDEGAVSPLITALARSDGNRQLVVTSLSVPAVRDLTSRVTGEAVSDAEADELTARTGGNPLFVSEYARLSRKERLNGDIPLAVRAVVDRRLGDLRPEVMQALRAAAVIGDVLDMATLSKVTGSDANELADLLDEAADEHVIVPSPDTSGYAFAHGLVREAVLAGLPAMRRQRLHARVAQALQDAGDGDQIMRRAPHLLAALPLIDASEVLAGCVAAARTAEERWSSETAAEWWAQAVRAFDRQPVAARRLDERDKLMVAHVAALARAGRGQTVLDVLEARLLDAMRSERISTAGRLASSLLRTAGAWPWNSYGEDPGPLLERLGRLERFVADDPAAHVRVLAALAVGHCYDPDPTVPDRLSALALQQAEALGDADVLADALLGRLITYSGVAAHARESVDIAQRLRKLEHDEARVDTAIGRSVASMALLTLGDAAGAADEVREGVAESDLLRLTVIRLQLRYMEGTLALWRGDFETAARHYAIAARTHTQTELYYSGSSVIAGHSLAREAGTLATARLEGSPEPDAWAAAIAAARGDAPSARAHSQAWLQQLGPWVWATHGHVVLLAHVAADMALTDLASDLIELLKPYSGLTATIGHIGNVGPVDLASGRLHALLEDRESARSLLERARDHAARSGGSPSVARCERALSELEPGAD